jgi:hypothetical protein
MIIPRRPVGYVMSMPGMEQENRNLEYPLLAYSRPIDGQVVILLLARQATPIM